VYNQLHYQLWAAHSYTVWNHAGVNVNENHYSNVVLKNTSAAEVFFKTTLL